MEDSARVLGRMFDGIELPGCGPADGGHSGRAAGVPVWNGLTDEWHPTQALADLLTVADHSPKALGETTLCFLGDGCCNTVNSLLVSAATAGMDVRVAAPRARWPRVAVQQVARARAERSGAR